jgi:adenosylcobinamide kinase/adenosylcobinamide-phosphate guanylyltransferase
LSLQPNTAGRGRLTLVLGGARSGKSRHAQILAMATPPPWTYVATAQALDEEMGERIAKHKAARGDGWSTIEEPIELARAVAEAPGSAPVVVDCITLWLSNMMLGQHDVDAAVARVIKCLDGRKAPTIVVSSEVGAGLVPETPLGRAFRDRAGLINQHLAVNAHQVLFMVAGLAMPLKAVP